MVWEGEGGETRTWTYAELRGQTDRLARALRRLGVDAGDAVAIFMPMMPETVAAVMACSKIGAIWVPIFSGFGAEAVAVRLEDANVKVVLTADAFSRKGRAVPMAEVARLARVRATTVEATVVLAHAGEGATGDEHAWAELISRDSESRSNPNGSIPSTPCSSATRAGPPGSRKCPSRPRQVPREDRGRGRVPGRRPPGGGLALGHRPGLDHGAVGDRGRARPRLDRAPLRRRADPPRSRSDVGDGGTPRHHDPRRLAHVGPRPDPLGHRSDPPARPFPLRILASTGEPWNPDAYLWLHREVGGSRLPIINLSGGTEIGACFLSPLPISE